MPGSIAFEQEKALTFVNAFKMEMPVKISFNK